MAKYMLTIQVEWEAERDDIAAREHAWKLTQDMERFDRVKLQEVYENQPPRHILIPHSGGE